MILCLPGLLGMWPYIYQVFRVYAIFCQPGLTDMWVCVYHVFQVSDLTFLSGLPGMWPFVFWICRICDLVFTKSFGYVSLCLDFPPLPRQEKSVKEGEEGSPWPPPPFVYVVLSLFSHYRDKKKRRGDGGRFSQAPFPLPSLPYTYAEGRDAPSSNSVTSRLLIEGVGSS